MEGPKKGKGFLDSILDKLDKRMEEKARKRKCCCEEGGCEER